MTAEDEEVAGTTVRPVGTPEVCRVTGGQARRAVIRPAVVRPAAMRAAATRPSLLLPGRLLTSSAPFGCGSTLVVPDAALDPVMLAPP